MPTIKIFEITRKSVGCDRYDEEIYIDKIISGTPWEIVTQEELMDLRAWIISNKNYGVYNNHVLIEQKTVESIRPLVKEYLDKSRVEKEGKDKLRKQNEEKVAKATEKRKLDEVERDKKKLEELKKKLGEIS
jgi:hypothetical protein